MRLRFAPLLMILILVLPSCGGSPEWDDSQKTNFLRACRREAGYEKQDLCTPLAQEIEQKILEGASKSCLLFKANDIATAGSESAKQKARDEFDNC